VKDTERRGIDRLVMIVFVSDLSIFFVLGFLLGWMIAGIWAIFSLAGLIVLTLQRVPGDPR
jgi:hypothetical protein